MKPFKPTIIDEAVDHAYITMLLEVDKCPICSEWMMRRAGRFNTLFPKYFAVNQDAQMSTANIRYQSDTQQDGEYICEICSSEGLATFECALCQQRRSSDLKQESFGDPPEVLCKTCYTTIPAAQWELRRDELSEAHRWDFE